MLFTNYTRLGIMKAIYFLCSFLCCLSVTAQLDFDMDVSNGPMGGYADIIYTVTNLSPTDTYTNVTITHPDALIPTVVLNPSTLGPGIQVTQTGRIAISGDSYNAIGLLTTQATATAMLNGSMLTELSDGINAQGNLVEDGPSTYFRVESSSYGVIYIDNDVNGQYDPAIDSPMPHVSINLANPNGSTGVIMTNETGWWHMPDSLVNNVITEYTAVIDQSTFPPSSNNYVITDGNSPFIPNLFLAFNFRYSHGYTDGTSNLGYLEASAFLDTNANGQRDTGEINMPYTNFEFITDNDPTTSRNFYLGTSNSITKSDLNPGVQLNDVNTSLTLYNSYFTITTPNYDDILTTAGAITFTEFAVTENSTSNRDTSVHLVNQTPPNPGFESKVNLVIINELNGTSTGTLQFDNDIRATVLSITDSSNNDLLLNGTATANATGFSMPYSLNDFESQYYLITMSTPVTGVQIGDTFTHNVTINPTSTDLNATNNIDSIDVDVVASYDPNDVTEVRGPIILINEFTSSDYLEYTIRFQNMGSASAQFVRILSDLHPALDDSTFEIMTASHPYSYEKNGRSLDFFFDNIQLPPQATDPEGSNGFIKYRIKPTTYAVGDIIGASAAIYFDYNAPVFTEVWTTTFNAPASINDVPSIAIYPNPLQGNVLRLINLDQGFATLYTLDGKQIWSGDFIDNHIRFTDLNSGIYLLRIESQEQTATLKLVME